MSLSAKELIHELQTVWMPKLTFISVWAAREIPKDEAEGYIKREIKHVLKEVKRNPNYNNRDKKELFRVLSILGKDIKL
jgi:hypothetical protein